MENEKFPYQKQWEEYRKLRNISFGVFFIPYLLIFLLGVLFQFLKFSINVNVLVQLVIFFIWVFCYLLTSKNFYNWKCPRCGHRYFTWSTGKTNPIFLDQCQRCNLWKYEGSNFVNY